VLRQPEVATKMVQPRTARSTANAKGRPAVATGSMAVAVMCRHVCNSRLARTSKWPCDKLPPSAVLKRLGKPRHCVTKRRI